MTEEQVAQEINEHIRSLQWSKAEVIRQTGISFKTIDNLMDRNVLPTRIDKRRELAMGLGLDREAIPRMLAGEPLADVIDDTPALEIVENESPDLDDISARLAVVEAGVAQLLSLTGELLRRQQEVNGSP